MIANIRIPLYIRKGIVKAKKGLQKNFIVLGGDTETCHGEPICFQLAKRGEDGNPETLIEFCNVKDVWPKFLKAVCEMEMPRSCNTAVIYFHNLSFDLTVLMRAYIAYFLETDIEEVFGNVKVRIFCGKSWFAYVTVHKTDESGKVLEYKVKRRLKDGSIKESMRPRVARRIIMYDSTQFYRCRLSEAVKAAELPIEKYDQPEKLGVTMFTEKDAYFMKYAENDAICGLLLGESIVAMHREFDVPLSVGEAQFSQKVFKKHYLKEGERIPLPRTDVLQAALLSYHGGKNGYYVEGVQERHNIRELDVNSMYPWAMSRLPAFTKGLWKKVARYHPGRPGFYRVYGRAKRCTYPILCSHGFKYYSGDDLQGVWTTSYELEEALKTGEFEMSCCEGFVWVPAEDARNPLIPFVQDFYERKKTAKGPKLRMIKTILCGNYGKWIQSIPYSSCPVVYCVQKDLIIQNAYVEEPERVAGGLFNPAIASWITGMARVRLHQMSHRYNSLMDSTDSVKTESLDESEIGPELGQLSIKAKGSCIFFRNKLYVMYRETPEKFEIIHEAHHGFHGGVWQLLAMYHEKRHAYRYKRMDKVRESLDADGNIRPGRHPLCMVEKAASLKIEELGWKPDGFEGDWGRHDALVSDVCLGDYDDATLTKNEQKESWRDLMRGYADGRYV